MTADDQHGAFEVFRPPLQDLRSYGRQYLDALER